MHSSNPTVYSPVDRWSRGGGGLLPLKLLRTLTVYPVPLFFPARLLYWKLETDHSVFDSSRARHTPLQCKIGLGQLIRGGFSRVQFT